MSVRAHGASFVVDVKVAAKDNPSGRIVRVRHSAPTRQDAKRLELIIRLSIQLNGRYDFDPADADMRIARKRYLEANGLGVAELERRITSVKAELDAILALARELVDE